MANFVSSNLLWIAFHWLFASKATHNYLIFRWKFVENTILIPLIPFKKNQNYQSLWLNNQRFVAFLVFVSFCYVLSQSEKTSVVPDILADLLNCIINRQIHVVFFDKKTILENILHFKRFRRLLLLKNWNI